MFKLLIADDESRIRRGLRNSLNWNEMGINIAGEAEDGERALELAREVVPDIMLVDINMPFLNGLDLIKGLNEVAPDCIVIIVTGHDEFKYIHEALKLKVFDYILKPVSVKNLKDTIFKAIEELNKLNHHRNYVQWVNRKLDENVNTLRQTFFNNCILGKFTREQIESELKLLKMDIKENIVLTVIKPIDKLSIESYWGAWDKKLLAFAIINIGSELLREFNLFFFTDSHNNICSICSHTDKLKWSNAINSLERSIYSYLKVSVLIEEKEINSLIEASKVYKEIISIFEKKLKYKPVVMLFMKYIESNYYVNELSLETAAEKLNVSSSYLSKLLKQETGLSFIEYLTNIRIKKALALMEDPSVKLYEVAELVGYSNQHYFSKAFKKVIGFPPGEYKGGRSKL